MGPLRRPPAFWEGRDPPLIVDHEIKGGQEDESQNCGSQDVLARLFVADPTCHAPMLTKAVRSTDLTAKMITHAAKIAGNPEYILELANGPRTILVWNGVIDGFKLQGATVLTDNTDGLIGDITVLMRPWPVVAKFRDAMYTQFHGAIPADYWDVGPKSGARQQSSASRTVVNLAPLEYTPDVTFHSPMLAKSLQGQSKVAQALQVVHEIQSPAFFEAIFATPDQAVELFDCDVEGYPLQGMNLRKLDDQGRVVDFTVLLRPWPVVSILRDLVIKRNLPFLTPDYWSLPEHALDPVHSK